MLFAMKPPPAQKKLQEELNKVKVDTNDKLVPKGGEFTRYLSLPKASLPSGFLKRRRGWARSLVHTDRRQGKLPGAVYRMSLLRRCSSCVIH